MCVEAVVACIGCRKRERERRGGATVTARRERYTRGAVDSAAVVAVVVHALVGKAMENSNGSSCDKEDGDGCQGNKDSGGGSCRFRVKRKKERQGRKKESKEKERKKKERRKRTKIGSNLLYIEMNLKI